MLQPSIPPIIRDYKAAQDSVGEFFSDIGLVRGERRKQAIREALENGKTPPETRRHVRPEKWRELKEKRLAEKVASVEVARRTVASREREAGDVIEFAETLARSEAKEDDTDRDALTMPETRRTPTGPGHAPSPGMANPEWFRVRKAAEPLAARSRQWIGET